MDREVKRFLEQRIRLVRDVLMQHGSYEDCCLVLCAVMSACAAARWEGRGQDKKRFVELLVRHSRMDHHADWVCVPAMISGGVIDETGTIWESLGESTRILTDEEIDRSLADAKANYPDVAEGVLRRHSYACLIYEWLRCGYSHQYAASGFTSINAPARRDARVSYIGRGSLGALERIATFHLDYLLDLAERQVANYSYEQANVPSVWWLDGAA